MRYQHDCGECKELGEYHEYDLYVHDSLNPVLRTFIARYSNQPSGYLSGFFGANYRDWLREAKARAGGVLSR